MTERWPDADVDPTRIPGPSPGDDVGGMGAIAEFDAVFDEAVVAGASEDLPVELVPVARFATELRRRARREPVPPMSAALRAQLVQGAATPTPVARAARRSLVLAAAAVAAVVALLSAGAAQNRLPTRLQDVVSSTAGLFGVDVPRADERSGGGSLTDQDDGGRPAAGPGAPGAQGGGTGPADGPVGSEGQGATPADPNGPGEPATPATPPERSGRGGRSTTPPSHPNGGGSSAGGAEGQGQGQSPPPSNPQGGGSSAGGNPTPPSNPAGGGTGKGQGQSPPPSNPNGAGTGQGGPSATAPGQRR